MTLPSPLFVGIDCGTQSAKVSVFEADGRLVAVGRQALSPMERPEPGVVLHPEDDMWDATCAASRAALGQLLDQDQARIAAVGVCPIRCNKAFLDADGELVMPMMSWMDTRAYEPWTPDAPIAYATTSSGYFAHRMTGLFRDTAANCIPLQWPIDPATGRWSSDDSDIDRFGLQRDQLVELQDPGEVIGPLTAQAAAATGLPPGIPVVATASDKAVELLGAGPLPDRGVLISLGTYITAMQPSDGWRPDGKSHFTNFGSSPHTFIAESNGIRRGMWTLTWFLDFLGPEFAAHAQAAGQSREDIVEVEAADLEAGADGLVAVLDFLAPTDAPFRKGTFFGLDARHTRGHMYRAILEAIALTMKVNVDAMRKELGQPAPTDVVLSGGGSNSELFTQIFADVFGCTAHRAQTSGGAGLGAAMCAAAGLGLHETPADAAAVMVGTRTSMDAQPDRHRRYRSISDELLIDIRETPTDALYRRSFDLFG